MLPIKFFEISNFAIKMRQFQPNAGDAGRLDAGRLLKCGRHSKCGRVGITDDSIEPPRELRDGSIEYTSP